MAGTVWQTVLMLEWTQIKVVDGVDLRLVASAAGIRAIQFGPRAVPVGSKKQAAFQAAGPAESESAGKIACPTSDAFPWGFTGRRPSPTDQRNDRNPLLTEAARQLRAYFAGQLREFQLPLDTQGTNFQKHVWSQVAAIPYSETRSYLQISTAIGSPRAVRAVGAANGANPVPIVVPCHRVIGAKGSLVGYGGGLAMKKRLLEMESAIALRLAL